MGETQAINGKTASLEQQENQEEEQQNEEEQD